MQAEFVEYSELILDAETEAIGRVRGVLPGWMIESGIADPDDDPYEVVALREKVLQDGDDTFRYYLMMRSLDDPETDPDSFSHSIDLDRDGWAALRLLCDRVLARLDHDAGVEQAVEVITEVKVSDSTPLRETIERIVFDVLVRSVPGDLTWREIAIKQTDAIIAALPFSSLDEG